MQTEGVQKTMKCGSEFFCGILSVAGIVCGFAFGVDIPDEVWQFRDKAISNSVEVCISAEKLKTNYKILDADETISIATYKVADFPKRGIQAVVTYRPQMGIAYSAYREAGRRPLDEKELEKWEALVREKEKQFPKPFPVTVVCLDDKGGHQIRYEFSKGELFTYVESFEDPAKQGVFMQFHRPDRRLSNFVRTTKGGRVGMQYLFDKEGNLWKTNDHGLVATDQRNWEELIKKLKAEAGVKEDE